MANAVAEEKAPERAPEKARLEKRWAITDEFENECKNSEEKDYPEAHYTCYGLEEFVSINSQTDPPNNS